MEVVGVVAAASELLKLAKRLSTAIAHISSKGVITKAAKGLRAQLELLSEVLDGIQQRDGAKKDPGGHADCLVPILNDTRKELEELQLLVDKVEDPKNNGPKFLKRAQLVLTGFDSQLKARSQRIDRLVQVLQVYPTDSAAQDRLQAQVRKLLKPSTSTTDFIPKKLHGVRRLVDPSGGNDIERVLVLYGVNGCGKSVLAASIADELRRRGPTAFFFSFWAGNSGATRTDVMFRTILWQLLEQTPRNRQTRCMSHLLENKSELKSTRILISQIKELGVEHGQNIYIILDGIDESLDDWNDIRDGPLGGISELLQSISHLRVLLAGRQASLRMARRRWPLHIELTPELVSDDIKKLIRHELDNCPEIHGESIKDCIQKELESKSTVMFLWVKLVFQELRLCFSEAEIHHTLSRLPDQLNEEYHRLFIMLSKRLQGRQARPSVGMQRAKDILGLIIGAARPLTLTELRLAYAYSAALNAGSGYCERSITEEGIIDACGDIITLRGELVYLGHTTLRAFLVRQPDGAAYDGTPTADYFRLESGSYQNVMALACLREFELHSPFLGYASSYLVSHFLNSNMGPDEAQGHLETFLQSEKAFSWLEFVIFMENDATRQAALPPSFLEDMVQLASYLDSFIFAPGRADPDTNRIKEKLSDCFLDYGLVDGLIGLANQQDAPPRASSTSTASPMAITQNLPSVGTNKGGGLTSESLQTAVQNLVSRNRRLGGQRFALISTPVQTCVRMLDTLLNPLDLATRALGKALRGMSFLALMGLALSQQNTRPQEALRIGLLGLQKVLGKGDLREAWAQAMVGNMQFDDSVRVSHYRRSQEILESRPQNPLFDFWSLNAASSRASCLFDAGEIEEAKKVAKLVERKLLAANDKGKDRYVCERSTLRRQIYKMLDGDPYFVKNRLEQAFELGATYEEHDLFEDAERLLAPLAHDPLSVQLLGNESASRALKRLGGLLYQLGKMDESADAWRKYRDLLLSQIPSASNERVHEIRNDVDKVSMLLAWSLLAARRKDLAQKEVASVNSFAFIADLSLEYQGYGMIKLFFDLVYLIGGCSASSKKVAKFLRENMKYIEDAFIYNGHEKRDAWQFVAHRFLEHGIFDEAEGYISQVIAETTHSGRRTCAVEDFYLFEALAFSTRCQNPDPKLRDPYDYYLACRDYTQSTEQKDELLTLRHHIGFGMHCAATSRRTEATRAFTAVIDGFHDITCGSHCIGELFRMLFRALAALQQKKMIESIFQLSLMIDEIKNTVRSPCCELLPASYQWDVLLIAGHFYLASIFDECGMDPAVGNGCRDDTLAVIKKIYAKELERDYIPTSKGPNLYVVRWIRSCVSYAEKRKTGEITSTVRAEEFPI